ncbi:MAG: WXG100 family type VII secretion target [Pseudomonadota bacterium]|nr:WXG100 family type VII secretion target [Pseudomonadota bacterium]
MAGVTADPEQLEELARDLAAFTQETREQLARLNARLHEMGQDTWRDARYQEYEEMFERTRVQLAQVLEHVDTEHVPHLRGLAERLRTYLS